MHADDLGCSCSQSFMRKFASGTIKVHSANVEADARVAWDIFFFLKKRRLCSRGGCAEKSSPVMGLRGRTLSSLTGRGRNWEEEFV